MGKIAAGASSVLGLVFVVLALAGPATAIPAPRAPSVKWIQELGKSAAPQSAKVEVPVLAPLPAKLEPAKPEPAKPAPVVAKPEPAKPEPAVAKPEPAKPQPAVAKPEPAKPEPAVAKPEPAKPEPAVAKPEPAKPEPAVAKPEPAKPEPAVAKPEPLVAPKPEPQPKAVAVAPVPKPAPKAEPKAEPAETEEGIGTLSVTSTPPGAAVFLDGANVGQTPIDLDVPAGSHRIRAVPPGDGVERRQSVIVKPNVTAKVDILF